MVYTTMIEATRGTTTDLGVSFFQLGEKIVVAENLGQARAALTVGLKKMTERERANALAAAVRSNGDDRP